MCRVGPRELKQADHLAHEVILVKLARADVDRQREVRELGVLAPLRLLAQGGFHHPVPQRHDQAGVFRQGNEFTRGHHAVLRVLPAHKGFCPCDTAGFVHLGLVEQQKLVLPQTVVQFCFQRGAAVHGLLHVRVEKAQRVAPRVFRAVHRHIGLFEDFVHAGALPVQQRDADAGRAMVFVPRQVVGLCQVRAQHFAQHAGLACGLGGVGAQVLQHHHELVSTQARHGIEFAHMALEAARHFREQHVAHLMPARVVQGLEVVQVYKQHGRRHSRAAAAGQHLLQAVYQQAAVGQLGQGIVKSQVAGFFLGGLATRNVDVDAEHLWGLSRYADVGVAGKHIDQAAVLAL